MVGKISLREGFGTSRKPATVGENGTIINKDRHSGT